VVFVTCEDGDSVADLLKLSGQYVRLSCREVSISICFVHTIG